MIHRYLPCCHLWHFITRQCAVYIRGGFGGLVEGCRERGGGVKCGLVMRMVWLGGGEGYVIGKERGVQRAG